MASAIGQTELEARAGAERSRARPPRVREAPLIGSAVPFLADPVRYLLACYRRYGPVYRIRLGTDVYTVIAGLEGSSFMTREGRTYVTSEGVWSTPSRLLGGDPRANMTNVDGARHAELRAVGHRGMSKGAACESLATTSALAREQLAAICARDEPRDAVDVAREIVFSQLGQSMAGAAPPRMFGAAHRVLTAIVRGTRLPVLQRMPASPSLRRAVRDVRELSASIVSQAADAPPPYLASVLAAIDSGVLTRRDLPMLMLTPFIAGLDTFAHTWAFVLYRLCRHPDWQERLRAEGERALDGPHLDADGLARRPELGFFIQEAMRIHPLSPVMMRRAKCAFVLEGYRIDAGERLLFPHTMPHLMDEVFPDPERFDPLRFHPARAEHRGPGRYAPYGIGPHVCLGAGTADVLLRANTATLLASCEVRFDEPGYRLRVSNTSGARPVGLTVRVKRVT